MPTLANEKLARAPLTSTTFTAGNVNTSVHNTPAQNASIETALSLNGLTAKVIVKQGQACKLKWFKNGVPVTSYYSKNYVQADAIAFINQFMA